MKIKHTGIPTGPMGPTSPCSPRSPWKEQKLDNGSIMTFKRFKYAIITDKRTAGAVINSLVCLQSPLFQEDLDPQSYPVFKKKKNIEHCAFFLFHYMITSMYMVNLNRNICQLIIEIPRLSLRF